MSKALQTAINEIKQIKTCKLAYQDFRYYEFNTDLFKIGVYDLYDEIKLKMAVKSCFDRWANSTDFEDVRSALSGRYYSKFKPQYQWAVKVLESGLFDFNSYMNTIYLPRFTWGKNP